MIKKTVTVDLEQFYNEAIRFIEDIVMVHGFSHQIVRCLDVKKIELKIGFNIDLFPDLQRRIFDKPSLYHEQYLNYISKKCIDDLYHVLENFFISCFKELRLKLNLFQDIGIDDNRLNIWKIREAFKENGINFDEDIFCVIGNLNEIRKSIHFCGILQKDAIIKYKSFDTKCFAKRNGALEEVNLLNVVDHHQFDEGSLFFEYSKNLVDKTKKFQFGTLPTFSGIEFQELVMTIKDIVIPRINNGFGVFFDNYSTK